jgi:hypothetical protein
MTHGVHCVSMVVMTDTCPNCERLTAALNHLLDRHENRRAPAQLNPEVGDVSEFLAKRTYTKPDFKARTETLYAAYVEYCRDYQVSPLHRNRFGMTLTALGYGTARNSERRYRVGLALIPR